MKYTFMQKNNKVMDVEMDPYYGDVEEILQVHDPRRVPLSVQYRDKRMKEEKLSRNGSIIETFRKQEPLQEAYLKTQTYESIHYL